MTYKELSLKRGRKNLRRKRKKELAARKLYEHRVEMAQKRRKVAS